MYNDHDLKTVISYHLDKLFADDVPNGMYFVQILGVTFRGSELVAYGKGSARGPIRTDPASLHVFYSMLQNSESISNTIDRESLVEAAGTSRVLVVQVECTDSEARIDGHTTSIVETVITP